MGSSSVDRGICVKPGNITLDLKKLAKFISGALRSGISAVQAPIFIPMIAFDLWDSLSDMLRVPLSRVDAVVLWILLLGCDERQHVDCADLLGRVNSELLLQEAPQIESDALATSVENLERIGIVERLGPNRWHLKEPVGLQY
jgi:hypothetical protein